MRVGLRVPPRRSVSVSNAKILGGSTPNLSTARIPGALKRWKFDIVSMDEVVLRAGGHDDCASPEAVVSMTSMAATRNVDGIGLSGVVPDTGGVPFTVLPANCVPDGGLGEGLVLALEDH